MCNASSFATDHLLLQLVAEAKATNSLLERVLERMQWPALDETEPEPKQGRPCTRPPEGWKCTRGFHEDGPCAAVPTNPNWLKQTISYVPPEWQHPEKRRSSLAGDAVTERRKLNGPLDRRKSDYKIMTPEVETPRIGTVATPSHVGVRTWQQLDCPKCRQRITVDVTEAVSQAKGN